MNLSRRRFERTQRRANQALQVAVLVKVWPRLVALCRMGLLTEASVAIDDGKFKAVNKPRQELHAHQDGPTDDANRGERFLGRNTQGFS